MRADLHAIARITLAAGLLWNSGRGLLRGSAFLISAPISRQDDAMLYWSTVVLSATLGLGLLAAAALELAQA
jgi:hypothetical protein